MSDYYNDMFNEENKTPDSRDNQNDAINEVYSNADEQNDLNADIKESSANKESVQPVDTVFTTAPTVNSDVYSNNGYSSAQWGAPKQQGAHFNSSYQQPHTNEYSNPYQQQNGGVYTNPYSQIPTTPKKKKEKKSISAGVVAIVLVLSVLLSCVCGFAGAMLYTNKKVADAEISSNGAMIINKVDIDEETAEKVADKSTAQITDEVADTVVEITTEVMSTNSFYGQYISQGAGSGVIISSDGYIVTNNHVIDGASSITVTLRDKTTYEAKLVGTDSIIDVALLKIDATNLKAAKFGDSDKLKVGDKAVAIGNPLGQLGGTVTDGIISALDRDVVIDDETMSLLQTDSAINPGNSGGGLFDGQGALIGIVVAKSSGEEIEGLGFAIPINDVIDILDDLKEHGYVRGRVSVGMQLIDLSNSMYSMYYYGNSQDGCYVYSVDFDSAAYKAGVQQGDRIVSVDGKEISTSSDVEKALEGKKVGDVVTFKIERNGRTADVELELGEYIPQNQFTNKPQEDIFNPFS